MEYGLRAVGTCYVLLWSESINERDDYGGSTWDGEGIQEYVYSVRPFYVFVID